MKALFFDGQRLQLREMPVPQPEAHEALIRVLYAGICNTDVEILKGYMNFTGVPGHEFVGIVEKAPFSEWVGKRVVGEINIACGNCLFCRQGLKTHCTHRKILGIHNKDGVMAEYVTLPVQNLHVVPPEVPELQAVFTEPLAAALEILEQLEILPEYRILLLGDGKLAQLIAQVLKLKTDNLLVVGKSATKLQLLERFGIRAVSGENFAEEKNSFHVVVEATGNWKGWEMALEYVRPRGFVVVKSTYVGDYKYNPSHLVINEITVIGSRCGPFAKALSLLERNQIHIEPLITDIYRLTEFEEAFKKTQEPGSLKIILQPDTEIE